MFARGFVATLVIAPLTLGANGASDPSTYDSGATEQWQTQLDAKFRAPTRRLTVAGLFFSSRAPTRSARIRRATSSCPPAPPPYQSCVHAAFAQSRVLLPVRPGILRAGSWMSCSCMSETASDYARFEAWRHGPRLFSYADRRFAMTPGTRLARKASTTPEAPVVVADAGPRAPKELADIVKYSRRGPMTGWGGCGGAPTAAGMSGCITVRTMTCG
jgi:hypothetical protein